MSVKSFDWVPFYKELAEEVSLIPGILLCRVSVTFQ